MVLYNLKQHQSDDVVDFVTTTMQESHQDEWEELLARRLITQSANHPPEETPEMGDTRLDRGGEQRKHVPENSTSEKSSEEKTNPETQLQPTVSASAPVAFAKVEKSLISLGFFTPSSRRIKDQKVKRITFTRTIDGQKVEATAEFHPSAVFGLPITADQDKFLALHDIITNILRTDGKVTNPIRFTSAQLLRLLNSRVRAGKNYRDISEWLDVMTSTTIISNGVVYEAGKQRFARDRFHVFQRAVSVGKEMPDGTIADANYVWLSDWQLDNINQNFLLPIDLQTYRELKNHIAKALVPLLQVWLFASQRAGLFEKRYDELCEMLSLQIYKAPSLITRQLKPSFDELVHYEYLKEWRIEKTSDRKAYKIVFVHGQKFHRDRRRRLDQQQQTEPPVVVAQYQPNEPDLPLPGKLDHPTPSAPLKKAKKSEQPKAEATAAPATSITSDTHTSLPEHAPASQGEPGGEDLLSSVIDELSTRGIMPSVAMKLLRSFDPERLAGVCDFIDYWDSVKKTRDVAEGFLITLIREGNSLPANFETRAKREKRLSEEDRRQKLQAVKDALSNSYEDYRRARLDRFITEELGTEEFERRVSAEAKQSSGQEGFWNRPEIAEQMARHRVRAEIAEKLNYLSGEDFRMRELPRILAELKLDPKEVGIELAKPNPAQMETTSQNAPDGPVSDF